MLTDAKIKAAKSTEKPRKLADAAGLYLLVKPKGARFMAFSSTGTRAKKNCSPSVGTKPGAADHVSLAEARDRLSDAKRMLRDGIDPSAARRATRVARDDREVGSFESVALEWPAKQSGAWSQGYAEKELAQLRNQVLPYIGGTTFRELKSRDLLDVCRRVEEAGHVETAHRVRRSLGQICRYAVVTHRADSDVSTTLQGALAPVKTDTSPASQTRSGLETCCAQFEAMVAPAQCESRYKLSPLVFVRQASCDPPIGQNSASTLWTRRW
jgi:hypothetical protein